MTTATAAEDDVVATVHAAVAATDDPVPDGRALATLVRRFAPLATDAAVARMAARVRHRVEGLGQLEPVLADPTVSDVLVNGPDQPVWVERSGRLEQLRLVLDRESVDLLVQRILAPLGRRADRTNPLVDARLPDGSRVHIAVPPLAVDGPCLTIRRFGVRARALDELAPPGVAELLAWAVRARLNLVATGGTGAGKTTLLNALAAAIPPGERIVTVEDAAELRLPHDHVVRLETRPAGPGLPDAVEIRDLVRNALRMRPDRILVGEVRGAEALDLLQAMSTGHEGALSTCHANSATEAVDRLALLVLAAGAGLPHDVVRAQVRAAVDLVVHIARLPGGARRVVEVVAIDPDAPPRPLAGRDGLLDLPTRPPRDPTAGAPDPRWVG